MLDLQQLIADFEDCIGWPYATPGTNDERGIDCSGMFVRAYRLQGARIYHGSNTIWRNYLSSKGRIRSLDDLRPGMAVFKWKAETPAKFDDDEGDFCHIGLVTSVSPLRIVHASTQGMQVRADTKLGKWKYWGVLTQVNMEDASPCATLPTAILRRGDRGSDVKELQRNLRSLGYDLEIDGIFGPMTECCVRSFQGTHGLAQDGIVGPMTWAALGGEQLE
ncbi:MAG: peptidoglycan-binding protein [Clostridia bacterium]|nr:peptidoglycan-binding protein [Clostridia bacterium]